MESNLCLSLSHPAPPVQRCVSVHCFQSCLPLHLFSWTETFFPPHLLSNINHPSYSLMSSTVCFFAVFSTNLCLILLSSPKAPFFDSKRMLIGCGSQTHRCCLARSRACSDWSWCLSTALCSWPSTGCFLWLMFALRPSWNKTSFSGATIEGFSLILLFNHWWKGHLGTGVR